MGWMLTPNKRGLHLFVCGYTSTSKTTCGVPRLIFMAKSTNCKSVFSIEDAFQASKSITVQNPKHVVLDNRILLKIKNIITDFPEYELSNSKLVNAIVSKWLEEHREELMQQHISNSINRY